jgi:hypothetical protein
MLAIPQCSSQLCSDTITSYYGYNRRSYKSSLVGLTTKNGLLRLAHLHVQLKFTAQNLQIDLAVFFCAIRQRELSIFRIQARFVRKLRAFTDA